MTHLDRDSVDSSDPLQLSILDVGHGNAAIVRDGNRCSVIDAAPGNMIEEELTNASCEHIEHLIISHTDRDHADSGRRILLDDTRTVGIVWYNADGEKRTNTWEQLRRAVYARFRRGGLKGHRSIHSQTGESITCGRATMEVCHPSSLMADTGPMKNSSEFGTITANTVSVVIRVHLNGRPAALLAADIDGIALDHIRENDHTITAPVLVFPHHGGRPGTADPGHFACTITKMVQPELVIFSLARNRRYQTPRPDILAGIRSAAPSAHIACTQLSIQCHKDDGSLTNGEHLNDRSSAGRQNRRCCAGTVVISYADGELSFSPSIVHHRRFVASAVSAPLCHRTARLPTQRTAPEV